MADGEGVITSKGRITIPADVRKVLGLRAGDRVEFVVEGKAIKVVPPRTIEGDSGRSNKP